MSEFSPIVAQIEKMVNDVLGILPNVAVGFLVFIIFYLLSSRVGWAISAIMRRSGRSRSAGLVFGRMGRWLTILFGVFVALTIILPSFQPVQLIEFFGITSVAIGFAFRDILQNFLAGILILLTDPFRIGDQIVVSNYEGTVEDIQTRATFIRTYDGRRVVIPNSNLFTESVIVNTASPYRRTEYDVGIGYGDDIPKAKALILEALLETEGVLSDPAPDALVMGLADNSVTIRARWWSEAFQIDVLVVQDRVIAAIKYKLLTNGIDIPFPTHQILFHDQTEETDGDRARQREGWPAGSGKVPKPRGIANTIAQFYEKTGTNRRTVEE